MGILQLHCNKQHVVFRSPCCPDSVIITVGKIHLNLDYEKEREVGGGLGGGVEIGAGKWRHF